MHTALFLVSTLLLLSGCAHTVEYDLTANDRVRGRRISKVVEVKKFEDKIPLNKARVVRIDGQTWRTNPERGYTEGDLAFSLTGMVAKHLEQSGLFRNVIYKGGFEDSGSWSNESQWVLTGVIAEYSVLGKVNKKAETKARVAGLLGTPGRVIGAVANLNEETEIRVKITLQDVTLKDVKSGRILWKDSITCTNRYHDDFEAAAAGPVYDPADVALKAAVSELIQRMARKLEKSPGHTGRSTAKKKR